METPRPQETCQSHHRFRTAIMGLLGPSRKSNEFCADNRGGRHVEDMSGGDLRFVLGRIERKKKINTLVEYMCPGPEKGPPERNYVWNLTHVDVRRSCGTVEFRGAGMSGSKGEVEKWVTFVVGFVRSANLAEGNSYDPYADTDPTRRDLLDFVRGGILPPARRSLRRFKSDSQE